MQIFDRDLCVYTLDAAQRPIGTVEPGQRFVARTHDCRAGSVRTMDDIGLLPDTSKINPATGPIAVAGAVPGDTVGVHIERIDVEQQGIMFVRPGATIFSDVTEPHLRIVTMKDGMAHIGDIAVPVEPMLGLVAVAPDIWPVNSAIGGRHGGNMDTRLITAGSRVYLPVLVPGALLYLGDAHAAQGDGEVFLTGIEVAAEVEASLTLLKQFGLPTPLVVTEEFVAPVSFGTSADQAARDALGAARQVLQELCGMDSVDAGFVLSSACHLRVSQFIPGMTIHCRVDIPVAVLDTIGIRNERAGANLGLVPNDVVPG